MPFVKVSRNGVITIPKGIRESLGIDDGGILEVEVKKSNVILKPKHLVDVSDIPLGEELSEKGKKMVIEAIKSHRQGKSKGFNNVEDLIKDLKK